MKPIITFGVGVLWGLTLIAVVGGIAVTIFGVCNYIRPDLVSWLQTRPPYQVVTWGIISFIIGFVISNLMVTHLDRTSGP